ncbi:hypothetical protein RUM43_009248 [Polyplax serrata]|uniref:Uncharacterized protein n=1 Tax=Polyplax serrata TaxID=468196 RepID=A0AAN8NQ12_POLSC
MSGTTPPRLQLSSVGVNIDATQKRSRRLLVVVGMKEAPEGANGEGSSCKGEKSRGAELGHISRNSRIFCVIPRQRKKTCKESSRSSRRDRCAALECSRDGAVEREQSQGLKQKINRQGEGGEKVRSMSDEVSLEIADGEIQSSETSLIIYRVKIAYHFQLIAHWKCSKDGGAKGLGEKV